MDINATPLYVFTCDIFFHHFSQRLLCENSHSNKRIRVKLSGKIPAFHQSLYCDLSVIDLAISGYDFPKKREYYVAAAVNNEASKKTAAVVSTAPSWDETLYL